MFFGTNVLKIVNNALRVTRVSFFNGMAEVYRPFETKNKDKIIELVKEKWEHAAKTQIGQKMKIAKEYCKVEMAPPASNWEIKQMMIDLGLVKDCIMKGCFKFMTVKQVWLLFLVALEVLMWFYIGETIGKMHFVGYKV